MRELVQFVTITTDPANDTRNLAEHLGHGFTKTEAGYQVHGVVTHVIDREGRWHSTASSSSRPTLSSTSTRW
jgi:cytochrome oxidase Cu insertion factor (SCO1/SenC/PrrC family)